MANAKAQKTKLRDKKDIKDKKDVKVKSKKPMVRNNKTGQERSIFKGINSLKIHEIIF